jgi:propanol-preferring alcohol dehydrogenase
MKAAVVTSFTKELEVRELPVPQPGPGQVLVRIEASGLCHTGIHAAHGDWPVKPTPPFIPGHEGVGVITQVGAGVPDIRLGQRVAIAWLGSACGQCEFCLSGRETLCESQRNSGYSVDGAYAEYALASADYVVPVPDGVSSFDAAPLTCAGVTTYKAVKVSGARSSDLIAVFGIGGLGHLAVQYARISGASVVAVDIENNKLDLARELGAEHTVNARTGDPVAAIQDLGGADAAICLAVSPQAMRQAFDSLKRGGRLVLVALQRGPLSKLAPVAIMNSTPATTAFLLMVLIARSPTDPERSARLTDPVWRLKHAQPLRRITAASRSPARAGPFLASPATRPPGSAERPHSVGPS